MTRSWSSTVSWRSWGCSGVTQLPAQGLSPSVLPAAPPLPHRRLQLVLPETSQGSRREGARRLCSTDLYQLASWAVSTLPSSAFSDVMSVAWNQSWVMVRLFTPQELANITNKGFFYFNRKLMVKHLLAHHCKYALCSFNFNRKTLANLHVH